MFGKIENKKLDLLAAYQRKNGPSQFEIVGRILLIPCLIIVLTIVAFASIKSSYDKLLVSVREVQQINEALQMDIDKYGDEEYTRYLQLQEEYDGLQRAQETINSYVSFSQESYSQITQAMSKGMNLVSINYNQKARTIALNATSADVRNIEKYIKQLKELPQVRNVDYNGYSQSTKSVGRSKQTYYSFSIQIALGGE